MELELEAESTSDYTVYVRLQRSRSCCQIGNGKEGRMEGGELLRIRGGGHEGGPLVVQCIVREQEVCLVHL
jgi:hypothetical protein